MVVVVVVVGVVVLVVVVVVVVVLAAVAVATEVEAKVVITTITVITVITVITIITVITVITIITMMLLLIFCKAVLITNQISAETSFLQPLKPGNIDVVRNANNVFKKVLKLFEVLNVRVTASHRPPQAQVRGSGACNCFLIQLFNPQEKTNALASCH